MINLHHFIALDKVVLMIIFNDSYHSLPSRRCSGCQKKRSLRTDSFFTEFPKVALGTLLRVIFCFVQDNSQKRISQTLNLTWKLVSQICRRLQDLCSCDLEERPFIHLVDPEQWLNVMKASSITRQRLRVTFFVTFCFCCCCYKSFSTCLFHVTKWMSECLRLDWPLAIF